LPVMSMTTSTSTTPAAPARRAFSGYEGAGKLVA
jgi:hypothetical protein